MIGVTCSICDPVGELEDEVVDLLASSRLMAIGVTCSTCEPVGDLEDEVVDLSGAGAGFERET